MELPDWLKEEPDTPVTQASFGTDGGDGFGSSPGGSSSNTGVAVPDGSNGSNNNNNTQGGSTVGTSGGGSSRHYVGFKRALFREWKMLLLSMVMLILMNVPVIRYVFYPFDIFATWIHEMCHGMAALFLGGSITQLLIFPDTSGLAKTSNYDMAKRGFVISAGYQGTAVVGFLLLIFRRTKRGPRFGLFVLALAMIISTALWIRNLFGIAAISVLGILFLLAGWKLPSAWMRALYTVVCVTVSLNAIAHVMALFGSNSYVNGEPRPTDAHSMADAKGGTSWMWAIMWFCLALVMTLFGVVFAIPGPNEDPAFRCCGMCLDCGLFHICNATRKKKNDDDEEATISAAEASAETTSESP